MLRIPKGRSPWLTSPTRAFTILIERFRAPHGHLRLPRRKRVPGRTAPGRTHAAAPPVRVRRAAAPRGRGVDRPHGGRAGPHLLDDPVGAAGMRQDHARAHHRRRDPLALPPVLRRALGRQGDPGRDRRGPAPAAAAAPPHRPLRGRNPSLQQGPAGRLPAPRRKRPDHPDRRHDRKPLVRSHRAAAVALPRRDPEPPDRGGPRDDRPPGPRRRGAGARQPAPHPGARRPRAAGAGVRRGRALGPEQPGGGRVADRGRGASRAS